MSFQYYFFSIEKAYARELYKKSSSSRLALLGLKEEAFTTTYMFPLWYYLQLTAFNIQHETTAMFSRNPHYWHGKLIYLAMAIYTF